MTDADSGLHDTPAEAADTARRAKDLHDSTIDGVKGEQRTFAKAANATINAAQDAARTATTNAVDATRAGHDALRKASGQAADLWRASLDPLTNMQTELSRWMDQAWRQGMAMRLQGAPLLGESFMAALSGAPVPDIYETADSLTLVVDLPGLTAQDVHLSQAGETLIVTGERSETANRGEGAYRVRERRSGGFRRVFPLPAGVDSSQIDARFDKGVLTITIAKSTAAPVPEHAIEIKG
jgi:HSP20 family protein